MAIKLGINGFGRIVVLMGIANKAGLSRIGFVTETPPAR